MATPVQKAENPAATPGAKRAKIRNRIFTVVFLLLVIASLFTFLLNYSGFHDWKNIDSNLSIFVAVNVNIVLLTAVFYLILRNLFKLLYERKKPLARVGLKTKLIIAFVALSLPSTVFHLMASGFMAFLLETWSQGEQKLVLASAQVVVEALETREEQLLRVNAEKILTYLPRNAAGFTGADWLKKYETRHRGGVVVFDGDNQRIVQWATGPAELEGWQMPHPSYFRKNEPYYWKESHGENVRRHILLPLAGSAGKLKVEVFEVSPARLSEARKQLTKRFISRDLFLLVLSSLVVITLLIILAATWVSFYLARGFVTPIEKLEHATRLVSEGELGYQVDDSSLGPLEGDFAGLVSSFNLMSGQLKEQRRQLEKTTENLRSSHHDLGERNRLVELLLEKIDAGVLALDPGGNLTAMNSAAVRLAQPRSEKWQERHYRVVLGKGLVALLDEMLERMRAKREREDSQNLTISQNRKALHVEVTVLALENMMGKSEGVVVLLKDATAEQRRQRALAWREVARRVAHEIKNPLTPIQLSAQRIRRKYVNGTDGKGDLLDQCTETIIKEVSGLKKMVNEFSQFAQLPESEPVPTDLNAVIAEVAQSYTAGLPDNIRIHLGLDESLPPIPLDKAQMKRVFTNLIDNAMAAIPESEPGAITIQTGVDADGSTVSVEVADDGQGVPESIRARLFEPYASTKEGGTGLGLAIVNQIISDHHGFIRYSEQKPKGSLFSIEFRAR